MTRDDNGEARRVVQRAWEDEDYKRLLLRDPRTALAQLDIDVPGHLSLAVYDNSGATHHMVICTPCSCYPSFLGKAPAYWRDPDYKAAILKDPAAWLERMGTALADDEALQVVDTDVNSRAFVIPKQPDGELTPEAVAKRSPIRAWSAIPADRWRAAHHDDFLAPRLVALCMRHT